MPPAFAKNPAGQETLVRNYTTKKDTNQIDL